MWHVYVLASHRRVLYSGVTRNLPARIDQHKRGAIPGFTKQYNVTRLVYVEASARAIDAFEREKQIKRWRREKKIALIMSFNPEWKDLWKEVMESGKPEPVSERQVPPLRPSPRAFGRNEGR